MDVTLNITSGKTIKQRFDAPCTGMVAKALGKMKLEEEFEVMVTFESYQEGVGKPKQPLADDAKVVCGGILNFTVKMDDVLKTQARHNKLLACLMAPQLVDVVARFSGRLVSGKIITEEDVKDKAGLQRKLEDDPALKQRLETVLECVSLHYSVEDFAKALDDTYQTRCKTTHTNTKKLLEEMEELRNCGVVELLMHEHPTECMILSNYHVFLQLLD